LYRQIEDFLSNSNKAKKLIYYLLGILNKRENGLDLALFGVSSDEYKFKLKNEVFWQSILDNYYEMLRLNDTLIVARKTSLMLFDVIAALVFAIRSQRNACRV